MDLTADVLLGTVERKEKQQLIANGSCCGLGCVGPASYLIPSFLPKMSIAQQRTQGPSSYWSDPLPSQDCQVFNLILLFPLKNDSS